MIGLLTAVVPLYGTCCSFVERVFVCTHTSWYTHITWLCRAYHPPPPSAHSYIIDFYNAAPVDTMIAMHLDVRPALDTPGALWDRVRVQAAWMWSGRWLGEGAGTRDGVRGGESYGRPKGEGRAQSTAATQSTGTA